MSVYQLRAGLKGHFSRLRGVRSDSKIKFNASGAVGLGPFDVARIGLSDLNLEASLGRQAFTDKCQCLPKRSYNLPVIIFVYAAAMPVFV